MAGWAENKIGTRTRASEGLLRTSGLRGQQERRVTYKSRLFTHVFRLDLSRYRLVTVNNTKQKDRLGEGHMHSNIFIFISIQNVIYLPNQKGVLLFHSNIHLFLMRHAPYRDQLACPWHIFKDEKGEKGNIHSANSSKLISRMPLTLGTVPSTAPLIFS